MNRLPLLFFLAGLVSCGSSTPPPNRCVPNASAGCVCADGSNGAQVCRSDGTFGACSKGATACAADLLADGGSGGGTQRCVPNQSIACVCPDSSAGAQVCQAEGTYAPCARNGVRCAANEDGGIPQASIDFDVKFRPTGAPVAVDCSTAQIPNVRFGFFDQALDNLLRTEVTRPCVANARYRVSIDPGPYNIRVQGLNGQLVVCYETNQLYTAQTDRTETLTFIAEQHPAGAQGGCVYPQIVAPPHP